MYIQITRAENLKCRQMETTSMLCSGMRNQNLTVPYSGYIRGMEFYVLFNNDEICGAIDLRAHRQYSLLKLNYYTIRESLDTMLISCE